jgi:hypothetical protein
MNVLKEDVRLLLTANHRNDEAVFALFSCIDVRIITLEHIERDDVPRWMPLSSVEPMTLFRLLRDRCGGQARNRETFRAPKLLAELDSEHSVSVLEPQSSGAPAYRDAIFRYYSRLEVPGTNLAGDTSQLFLWPVLQEVDLALLRLADFEDEDPRYRRSEGVGTVDLRHFPNSTLKRAVVVAGAGFGKTTLLTAVAHRLSSTFWLPVLVPLPELAESGETVLKFLKEEVNRKFDVQVLWDYYCDNGRAVILFDGLDELTPRDRQKVLLLIRAFSSRHPEVPWLLTVRDAKAVSAPVEANTLKLDMFDYEQISALATAYKEAGNSVDVSELLTQIKAYPDLELLTRIPLFLALLLATTRPLEPLPRRRGDLIEHYLHVILHPDEYKPSLQVDLDLTELREVAERLAFTALEQGRTSLAEAEVSQILRPADVGSDTTQCIEALQICGIVRRSVGRVTFAFPIVQEYLAARYLITHFPGQLAQRFSFSARRPWAQMLQFALERHPDADQVIRNLLEHEDDAFGTTLRLIGQCIVNGAQVSATTRNRVGYQLGELWTSLPYTLRENTGKIIAHGFASPLPSNVRASLIQGFGFQSGGDDIVLACNEADLPNIILEVILDKDSKLHSYANAFGKIADTIAPEALQLCIQRAKLDSTTSEEAEALAEAVIRLPSERLPQDAYKSLIEDPALPSTMRLAGHVLGPKPVSEEACALADEVFRSPEELYKVPGSYLATRILWNSVDPVERWRNYVCDASLPETRREEILFDILSSSLTVHDNISALETLRQTNALTTNLEHSAAILKAYLGDAAAMSEIIDSIDQLNQDNLRLLAEILGKNRSQEEVITALRRLEHATLSVPQKVGLASNLAIGLTHDVEMGPGKGFLLRRRRVAHPAVSESARVVWEWANGSDVDAMSRIALLSAALELGFLQAAAYLHKMLVAIIGQESQRLQEYEFDSRIDSALRALSRFGGVNNKLPLSTLVQCVEASRYNSSRQAASMIAAYADEEALEKMLQLHSTAEDWLLRSVIEQLIEELGGRLGIRIIRSNGQLFSA